MSKDSEPVTFDVMVANKVKCSTCGHEAIYKSRVPWQDIDFAQCPHCGTNYTRIPTKRIGTFSARGGNR